MEEKKESSKESLRSIVTEAKERYEYAKHAYSTSRAQAIEDTKFAFGDGDNGWQWDAGIAEQRKADTKVCLTINLTAQHCNQILNPIRQQRPSGKVLPVDDFADVKTAEILSGLVRSIQSASNADTAHDIASEHMVYGGEGSWFVTYEYESPASFKKVVKVKPCVNPQLVFVDPDAIEPDKSDAEWGFIFEDVKKSTFERENPDIKDAGSWNEDNKAQWVTKETIRDALYFYCEHEKDTALLLSDGSSLLESSLADGVRRNGKTLVNVADGSIINIVDERETVTKKWKRCRIVGGHDEPIDLEDWPGDFLPIITVVGKEININGEIVRKGHVASLKDPARMCNYAYSETVQTLALQNKIPYLAAAEAVDGHEEAWGRANHSNDAYLPWNAFDENGNAIPKPERQAPPTFPAAQIQLLQISTEEMRGASGQHNANFGIKSEAVSGVGISRLQQQGDVATFHYPDNLARGIRYEIKIIVNLIQKIMDTKQVVRILGLDGVAESVTLDPKHPQAYSESRLNTGDIQKIFNPNVGLYDISIDTGPSYKTQRQEAFSALTELAGRSPALMSVAGDIIMRAADFPQAQELADRLKKTLPPALQDHQDGGTEQQLASVTAQAQQMQQQLEIMAQQLQEAQGKLQQADSGILKAKLDIEGKLQLAQLDAQMLERKLQIESNAKVQAAQIDAQLQEELALLNAHIDEQRQQREIIAMQERALFEARLKQDQIDKDADGKTMQAHIDACAKVKMNADNNESKEDIAELQAYVELEKVGIQNQALSLDVNEDFKEEKED